MGTKVKLKEAKSMDIILLTIDALVEYTGYKKSYIYKLTHERKIPHYKPLTGRKLFFSKTEIDEWLLANRMLTINEINNQ